jgi:hypothetical protein
MVFAGFGPENTFYHQAMCYAPRVLPWIEKEVPARSVAAGKLRKSTTPLMRVIFHWRMHRWCFGLSFRQAWIRPRAHWEQCSIAWLPILNSGSSFEKIPPL